MASGRRRNRQIAEEAADWAVKLDAGMLSDDDKQALATWLRHSPLHVEELLLSASIMNSLSYVRSTLPTALGDLLADAPEIVQMFDEHALAPDKSEPEEPLAPDMALTARHRRPRGTYLIAASLAAITVISVSFWGVSGLLQKRSEHHANQQIVLQTQAGEQRSLALDDGSIVHVNTMSNLRIRYSERERLVVLLDGEALFEVASDPLRPFRVHAGSTVAEAVGTEFNVRYIDDEATVSVVEGRVALLAEEALQHPPPQTVGPEDRTAAVVTGSHRPADHVISERLMLKAGERASVSDDGRVTTLANRSADRVTAWRIRKLVFDSDPLRSIAAEFNRYNHEQIYLDDSDLAAMEFSGTFYADDPHSFVDFLEQAGIAVVDRTKKTALHLSKR